jgi:hypothetical protein
MRLLLPSLMLAVVLGSAPSLAGTSLVLVADDAGVHAHAGSAAGAQDANATWDCLPDLTGHCTTDVNCDPGTLDCHAWQQPDPPGPCVAQPDGSLQCQGSPEHGPPPSPPGGGDALSAAACSLAPQPGEAPAQACTRLLAPAPCAAAPAPASLPAAPL